MSDLISRHIAPVAVEMLEHFPGIVVEGARQVGKSTLAEQIAAPDAVLMNLDHGHTRDAARVDPAGFVAQAGARQLVIDEIQRLPELTLAVKAAIDSDRRAGRFILTGSSSLLRVQGTADSLAGRVARRAEAVAGDAHLLLRSVPLTRDGARHGAIVLCRDVSDLRSKERELITKDATIREIHHRVKNNLQTVAALLRMQARRMSAPEAKLALNDAMSRVAAIAIVHETSRR